MTSRPCGLQRLLLGALLAAVWAFGATAPDNTASAAKGDSYVRAQGPWLYDSEGRVVMLRGVNLAESCKYPPFLPWQTKDDVLALKDLGFNCVRYLIVWEAVEPEPGEYDDAYLDEVAERLEWCREAGLKVILDMHQDLYSRKYGGDGAPQWACLDDDIPFEPVGQVWFMSYFAPAVTRVFRNFWTNQPGPGEVGVQDRFIAMWQHVANRFSGDTNIIGYDILNEGWYGEYAYQLIPALAAAVEPVLGPEAAAQVLGMLSDPENAGAGLVQVILDLMAEDALFDVFDAASGPAQEFEQTLLQPFYDRTIAAIRAVDPNHAVFVEPASGAWSGTRFLSALEVPKDAADEPFSNVVFAPHFYDFSVDFGFPYTATAAYLQQCLARAQAAGDRMGVPTWFGEWGAWGIPGVPEEVAQRQLLVRHHADAFDALLCGWAYWQYGADFLSSPFMPLLSRPYAQVIAGTPTAMHVTESALELEFAPQERRGETIIWAPPSLDADCAVTFAGKGHAKIRRDASGSFHIFCTPHSDPCTVTVSY
jgi:endoglycosylceramidase